MSHAIFCSATTGLKRCHRLALYHCSGCGRALCGQHAIRLNLFGGSNWVCSSCHRRKLIDPKKTLSMLLG